jgi:hypothetical protein
MSRPTLPPVERQVRRVVRRLFTQTLLNHLVWCWSAGLGLGVCWLLLAPLLDLTDEWLRWGMVGAIVLLATALAVAVALSAAPSRLTAALALDSRFGLRERVITSLSLPPGQEDSPAARALLADVNQRVHGLDVPSRFPVGLSWFALAPLGAAGLLAVVAVFYDPAVAAAGSDPAAEQQQAANARQAEQKFARLKKPLTPSWPKDSPKSKELKELEQLWEKMLREPLNPNDKDKLRERDEKLRPLEQKLKDRIADLKGKAARAAQLKDRLKQLEGPDPDGKGLKPKEGPGKDLRDALARGQFERAAEEVEKLRKKVQKDKLNPEEQKQLEKEMQDMKRQLQRLADMKEIRDRLEKAFKEGELAREQFNQQMEQLKEMAGEFKDLKDLAVELGECQQCLQKGDKKGAGEKMKALSGKLAKLGDGGKELNDLRENQKALREAREAIQVVLRGAAGQPRDQDKQGNGMAGGGPPGGRRPITKEGEKEFHDARQDGGADEKGRRYISGYRRGGTFSKIPAREVGGTFRQAAQEAPAAIERQRVPADARDVISDYFQNLRGQK